MIETNIGFAILALVAINAVYFVFSPYRLAEFRERDGLPVHWIMQHFRYWERRRVWISGVCIGVCVTSLFAASSFTLFALFVGLTLLTGADAFQVRQLSRDLRSWSPSAGMDQEVSTMEPILDLVFGRKATRDKNGE